MNRKLHRSNAVGFLSVFTKQQHRAQMSNRTSGFTLIELIACIVIIGILAAVAGPSMFNNTTFSERGYADEIAAAIRYANSVAVGSGCDTAVIFTATDYKVWQRPASGNTCAIAGAWSTPVLHIDGSPVLGNAPTNLTLSSSTPLPTQIVFDNGGAVRGGITPALTVGTHTITVDPVSGMATVQ